MSRAVFPQPVSPTITSFLRTSAEFDTFDTVRWTFEATVTKSRLAWPPVSVKLRSYSTTADVLAKPDLPKSVRN
jgi:hypothetical protein